MKTPPQHGLSPTRSSEFLNNGIDGDSRTANKPAAERRSSTPASSSTHHGQDQGQHPASKNNGQSSTKTSKRDQTPEAPAHIRKAVGYLLSEEAKLLKQIGKIEGSQLRVASKIETRQRKEAYRSEKNKSWSETETLRREIEDLCKEVAKLHDERKKWVALVASLQAENTKLTVAKESKGSGAP